MIPKSYLGKDRVASKLPCFDLERIDTIEGCGIFRIPFRVLYVILQCVVFIKWATRWKETERTGDIDQFIEEVYLSLRPIVCSGDVDPEGIGSKLEQILQAIGGLDMSVVVNNGCGCGCCCGGGGGGDWPTVRPDIPTEPPPADDTPIDVVNRCAVVSEIIDSLSNSLARMATASWGGTFTLGAIFAVVTVLAGPLGWIAVSSAAISLLIEAFVVGGTTTEILVSAKSSFFEKRGDLKCLLYGLNVLSGDSLKQKYTTWVYNEFIDGEPTFLILLALGKFLDWNKIYSQTVWEGGGDCSGCDEPVEPDTELPSGYSLVPMTLEFIDLSYTTDNTFSHSEPVGYANMAITLLSNNEFMYCRWQCAGATAEGITGDVRGLLFNCTALSRGTDNPAITSLRDIPYQVSPYEAMVGDLRRGGIAVLYSSGNSVAADFASYLSSAGIRVVDNTGQAQNPTDAMSPFIFKIRDKHRTSPAEKRLVIAMKVDYIVYGS